MTLVQEWISRNPTYTNGRRITVRGLMLHSIGVAQPDAMVIVRNQNRVDAGTSYHGMIDGSRERGIQMLPWNARAWHAGGDANNTHISVGMSEPNTIRYTGQGAQFVDNSPTATRAFVHMTYRLAVQLFAHLCVEFSLDPLRDGVILSHSEGHRRRIASNHADVEHLWSRHGLTMNQFRRDVRDAMGAVTQPVVGREIPPTRFRVVTGGSNLNCRAAPNASAALVGSFPPGTEVIATRESNGWFFVTNGRVTGWSSGQFLVRINDTPAYVPGEGPEPPEHPERPELEPEINLEAEEMYRTLAEVPEWARDTIRMLMTSTKTPSGRPTIRGVHDPGDGVENIVINLSETMVRMFVANDQAGLYEQLK